MDLSSSSRKEAKESCSWGTAGCFPEADPFSSPGSPLYKKPLLPALQEKKVESFQTHTSADSIRPLNVLRWLLLLKATQVFCPLSWFQELGCTVLHFLLLCFNLFCFLLPEPYVCQKQRSDHFSHVYISHSRKWLSHTALLTGILTFPVPPSKKTELPLFSTKQLLKGKIITYKESTWFFHLIR